MQNAKNYLLTTIDNPYNPFKDWDSWFAYDMQKGYRTCQILDRFYKIKPVSIDDVEAVLGIKSENITVEDGEDTPEGV